MQIGTTTVPFLPLAAVVVALLLVVLVLWGVRRARRHPAPAAVPGARTPDTSLQPCDADWTGEAANGYAVPRHPAQRPRTVADVVAERGAGTAPSPGAAPPGYRAPAPRGAHAAPEPDDGAPRPAPEATDTTGPVRTPQDAEVAGDGVHPDAHGAEQREAGGPGENRVRIDPATRDAMVRTERPDDLPASSEAELWFAPGGPGPEGARPDVSAPSDESPDAATLAALGSTPDPVPPPWSASRSEPADTGLEPEPDLDAIRVSGPAEPVSRAVQQALAARAVQRARRQRDDEDPDDQDPVEPEHGREYPLTVVPSAAPAAAGTDARDRLLSVLLADPARAVGATEDLDEARDRIDQLGDVLRRRRDDLALAVRRLHESGLDREQIGRLAGMGGDEVATILEARTGDGADGSRRTSEPGPPAGNG